MAPAKVSTGPKDTFPQCGCQTRPPTAPAPSESAISQWQNPSPSVPGRGSKG